MNGSRTDSLARGMRKYMLKDFDQRLNRLTDDSLLDAKKIGRGSRKKRLRRATESFRNRLRDYLVFDAGGDKYRMFAHVAPGDMRYEIHIVGFARNNSKLGLDIFGGPTPILISKHAIERVIKRAPIGIDHRDVINELRPMLNRIVTVQIRDNVGEEIAKDGEVWIKTPSGAALVVGERKDKQLHLTVVTFISDEQIKPNQKVIQIKPR